MCIQYSVLILDSSEEEEKKNTSNPKQSTFTITLDEYGETKMPIRYENRQIHNTFQLFNGCEVSFFLLSHCFTEISVHVGK